jgi:hypothetical protein
MTYTIGLLMVAGEDDILERTLDHNARFLDAFYVLDGAVDNTESERICRAHPKCWAYRRDEDLPRPPYTERTLCGYRKFIHDLAVEEHGPDNWFMVLHADEWWWSNPREFRHSRHDGFIYELPFFFPREGEEWDDSVHPIDQLHWNLGPGWPEFRLFKGNPTVSYHELQEFNTRPMGIRSVVRANSPIWHYPYRSPEVQRARAQQHEVTQFDPDNYQHIVREDAVYWTDEMIARYQAKPEFADMAWSSTRHAAFRQGDVISA